MQVIHLGLAVMATGIMGVETLSKSFDVSIAPDTPLSAAGATFALTERNSRITENGNTVFEETLDMIRPNGKTERMTASIHHLAKSGSVDAAPATSVGLLQDVQVVLKEVPPSQNSAAELRVTTFPLISWIWAGGCLMVGGGVVSMVNGMRKKDRL